MKDNTVLYLVLGGVAFYLITRKRSRVVTPYQTGQYYSNYNTGTPYYNPQPSQSTVLPILQTAATIFQKIMAPSASTNVSNGYNPDGSITLPNESQTSIQNLNDGSLLQTTLPPMATDLLTNNATSDPSGGFLSEDDYLTSL